MDEKTKRFACGDVRSLNLGCCRQILPHCINLDLSPGPGVDVVFDLEQCGTTQLPFEDNTFSYIHASHLLEHIRHPLPLMEELYRVAAPNCMMRVFGPHGASDDAYEDPTHVRPMYPGSFGYFSQPYYWRADYGYRGDWITEKIVLMLRDRKYKTMYPALIFQDLRTLRTVVAAPLSTLLPVTAARAHTQDLQTHPPYHYKFI